MPGGVTSPQGRGAALEPKWLRGPSLPQPAFRRLLGKCESFMDLSQDQEISI